jgi:alanine racemase
VLSGLGRHGASGAVSVQAAAADPHRPSYVEVSSSAITHNVATIRRLVAPSDLWAVVKADGYGHGAVTTSRAALAGGASGLAVAHVAEGEQLRAAGVAGRVLLLAEPPHEHVDRVVAARLEPAVYTERFIDAAALAASADEPVAVHLKVDTGMHRVGCDVELAVSLAQRIARQPKLRLGSMWTHLAVADEPDNPFTSLQLERFERAVEAVRSAGVAVDTVHMANSAGALVHPSARGSLVRCGIAIYGLLAGPDIAPWCGELRPAMTVRSVVSHVRRVSAGEGVSYGLRYRSHTDMNIATVPVGYADGVPRRLGWTNGEVLLGGKRRPIAGSVTMDQIMVACGDDAVAPGDEVVLLGEQGGERISAEEWAEKLGTITYEVVCGFGARMPRRVGD